MAEELKERAILETTGGGYIMAEDTGYFSVGDVREEGEDKLHACCVCVYVCVSASDRGKGLS